MKKLAAAVLVLCAACASTDDAIAPAPHPAPAADPQVAELQTALTELLERLDVLNDRIARLEEMGVAPAVVAPASSPVSVSTPAQDRPEAGAPAAAPETPREVGTAVPPRALVGARIAADYRNALALYGRSAFAEARRAFEEVYEADPSGDLADNALFWIGESYFAARDWVNAIKFYRRVVNEYAEQNKAPDALFKTAMALEKTGDLALARKTLQQVIERYPYSTPATTAKAELQRIRY